MLSLGKLKGLGVFYCLLLQLDLFQRVILQPRPLLAMNLCLVLGLEMEPCKRKLERTGVPLGVMLSPPWVKLLLFLFQ